MKEAEINENFWTCAYYAVSFKLLHLNKDASKSISSSIKYAD
jgi:hypothetical protein